MAAPSSTCGLRARSRRLDCTSRTRQLAGRIYELSSEHHVRNEVMLDHASNWQIYALQTEEERGEGGFALPLDIRDSSNITIREPAHVSSREQLSAVSRMPSRSATPATYGSGTCIATATAKCRLTTSIYDQTHHIEMRQREFSWLTISGAAPDARERNTSPVLAKGAKVEKVAGGFFNISGWGG